MSHWYRVLLWDKSEIWLEPDKAKLLQSRLQAEPPPEYVTVNDQIFATKNISKIEPTATPYGPTLTSGGEDAPKGQPLAGKRPNSVLYIYIKKRIPVSEFTRDHYAARPNWKRMQEDGSDIWVARTHVVTDAPNLGIPEGFVRVTEPEADILDKEFERDGA